MKFIHDLIQFPDLQTVNTSNGRMYIIDEDNKYPSITTILGAQQKNKAFLNAWRKRIGVEEANKISSQASRRGTAVHTLMENYISSEEEPSVEEMPSVLQTFKQIKTAVDKSLTTIRGIECPLYSTKLNLAGRCDLIGMWDDKLTVIDFKTSKKEKYQSQIKDYFIQATAYSLMFEERTEIPCEQIAIVIGCDDTTEAQVFVKSRKEYIMPLVTIVDQYHMLTKNSTWEESINNINE